MMYVLVVSPEQRQRELETILKKNNLAQLEKRVYEYGDIESSIAELFSGTRLFGEPVVHVVHVGKEKSETERAVTNIIENNFENDHGIFTFPSLLKKEKDMLAKNKIPVVDALKKVSAPQDVFSLVRAYERGSKKELWITYQKLFRAGISVEAMAGVLFWKLKTEIISRKSNVGDRMKQLVLLVHESRTHGASVSVRFEKFLLS